jgi:hypothetical protein
LGDPPGEIVGFSAISGARERCGYVNEFQCTRGAARGELSGRVTERRCLARHRNNNELGLRRRNVHTWADKEEERSKEKWNLTMAQGSKKPQVGKKPLRHAGMKGREGKDAAGQKICAKLA